MIIVPKHISSVTLFDRKGNTQTFPSKKRALKALGLTWIIKNVGPNFNVAVKSFNEAVIDIIPFEYILRDDVGETLVAKDFQGLRQQKRYWEPIVNNSPTIPGTAKPKAGTHYYRRIRHANARRNAVTFVEEGEVAVRPARNARNLPNNWDDYYPSCKDHHSWKQYRKQQWRVKKGD